MPLVTDWENRLVLVTEPTVSITGQELHDFIEDQMASPKGMLSDGLAPFYGDIIVPEGKIEDPNKPGVFSQIILKFSFDWQVQFWQGSGYTSVSGAKFVGGVNGRVIKATGAAGDITVLESQVDGIIVEVGSTVTPQDIKDAVWKDTDTYPDGSKGEETARTAEMLGISKGNPITMGNGKHLSNNLDITVTDNGDGTFTMDRQ